MIPRLSRCALAATAALGALGACGGGGSSPTDTALVDGDGDVAADSTPPGPPLLGGRAEIYDITATGAPRPWVPSTAALAGDLSEVIVIPLDLYGIPWSSFSGPDNQPTNLPGPWVAGVNALKTLATSTFDGETVIEEIGKVTVDDVNSAFASMKKNKPVAFGTGMIHDLPPLRQLSVDLGF